MRTGTQPLWGVFPFRPQIIWLYHPLETEGGFKLNTPPLTIFCPTDTLNVANTRNVLYTKYVRVKVLVLKISLCVHEGYQ